MDEQTKEVRYGKWAEIIAAASKSGMTKTEFCRQNGISPKKFFYYQGRIREGLCDSIRSANEPFVEVPIDTTATVSTGSAVVIHVGKISIEISDGISESTLMSIGRMIRNAL